MNSTPNSSFSLFHINNSWKRQLVYTFLAIIIAMIIRVSGDVNKQFIPLIFVYFFSIALFAVISAFLSRFGSMLEQLWHLFVYVVGLFSAHFYFMSNPPDGGGWLSNFQILIEQININTYSLVADFARMEIITFLFAVITPFGTLFLVIVFRKLLAKQSLYDPHVSYTIPGINNATFSDAAGWIGIVFPVTIVALMTWGFERLGPEKTEYLGVSYWFHVIFPVMYFGFAVQRKNEPVTDTTTSEARSLENRDTRLMPFYEALLKDEAINPHVTYNSWDAAPTASREPDQDSNRTTLETIVKPDIDRLASGGTVYRIGNPDAEQFYMLSEVISKLQDRGQTTFVICPDGAGNRVNHLLKLASRMTFPEIARVVDLWSAHDTKQPVVNPRLVVDVIVAEESAFSSVFVNENIEQRKKAQTDLLRRVGLFALIDFHNIDVCRYLFAFNRIDKTLLGEEVGLFVQMHDRHKLEPQINRVRTNLPYSERPIPSALNPRIKERGTILLSASGDLRRALANYWGYSDLGDISVQSENFFALWPRESDPSIDPPFPVFFLQGSRDWAFIPDDQDDQGLFETLIRNRQKYAAEKKLLRPGEASSIYLPQLGNPRLTIVSDHGNATEWLESSYSFWDPGDADQLVVIVSEGYPGRSYLLQRYKKWKENEDYQLRRAILQPMAQEAGIGVTEVASRLGRLLARPEGATQEEVAKTLGMASGDILNQLDVSATRRGLTKFFRLVFLDQRVHHIEVHWNERQEINLRSNISAENWSERHVWIREDSINGEPIVQVPYADEGLFFSTQEPCHIGRHFLQIERNSVETDGFFTASRLGFGQGAEHPTHAPFPRLFFERNYVLLASEAIDEAGEKTNTIVGESGPATINNEIPCWYGHIHISIKRTSTASMRLSSDLEPSLLLQNVRRDPLAIPISHRRPFRSVVLICFEDKENKYVDDDILRRTLAASLQVVLGLAIPALRRRIAVIPLDTEMISKTDDKSFFYCLYPAGSIDGCSARAALETLRVTKKPNNTPTDTTNPGLMQETHHQSISFAVIEDAAHDIGVSRRVFDDMELVLSRWKDFLDWAKDQSEWTIEGIVDANKAAAFAGFSNSQDNQFSGGENA